MKPVKPPKILTTRGGEQTKKNRIAYDNNPDDYHSGAKKFNFNAKLYGAKQVKDTLSKVQHHKCCYCERNFTSSYGAVEHFRPKGGVKQSMASKEEYPGYYWLAYEWDNLFVSCERCNTKYKSSLFPLANQDRRARSHHDDVNVEQPLFVNPGLQDPRDHIRFRNEAPEPRTEMGRVTIEMLGLRNSLLEDHRKDLLNKLKTFCELVVLQQKLKDPNMQELVKQAQKHLAAAVRPEAEYSSMAQDIVSKYQL